MPTEAAFADTLERSHPVRERAEHHKGAEDAGAPEPPFHLQSALQFPRYRIHVSESPKFRRLLNASTNAVDFRYLVVDLMNGGDLRFHISRKTFTEEAVRFWIAELGCALRYIHKQGIIHRDVKPDNVLLDSEGHIHLADFVSTEGSIEGRFLLTSTRMLHPISFLASH